MTTVPQSADAEMCPCLMPVVNDYLWIVRTPVYCRRPDRAVRVPARRTLIDVCLTPAYRECAGYRASAAAR